ncbi:MAG: glucose-fructose oxidoreductase [Gemmataceae bacterium]|nr:MAG: glucose-fructose oxidoreductase [Gemmataceae bacterium]
MSRVYRIGVLGLTHDHVWSVLREVQASGRAVLVAAADPHEELLARLRQEVSCTTYRDYDSVFEHETLDAVYIYSDNATGARLAVRAAEQGWHVLVEKPMAADLAGANRMLEAARRAGVRIMVNWPFAWWPQLQYALQLVRDGVLGDIWQVKYRAAHAGPKEIGCSSFFCDWLFDPQRNGAGALMDYGCYGALLARVVLGMPQGVTAVAGRLCKPDLQVEDNAVLLLNYPHALALAEASWTQVGQLTSGVAVIYGTQGTLLIEPRRGGRLLLANAEHPQGRLLDVPEPADPNSNATLHFVHALESGGDFLPLCCSAMGRDVQEILEASLQSWRTGRQIPLPLAQP